MEYDGKHFEREEGGENVAAFHLEMVDGELFDRMIIEFNDGTCYLFDSDASTSFMCLSASLGIHNMLKWLTTKKDSGALPVGVSDVTGQCVR